jgi:hypothetical protein
MKKHIFLFILLLISVALFGQFDPASWRQFESDPDLLKTLKSQYEENYYNHFGDSLHPEFKQYRRYLSYWHPRLGVNTDGEISYNPYLNLVLEAATNPICDENDPADWQLMGPSIHPKQQQGLFTEVLYDPEYPERLLASTNHGGLWKYNPDDDKWYNVTDNLRIPGLSANDLLRNPFDSEMIFAATGNGQYFTEYGVGILVSEDRGESWTVNQSFLDHVDDDRTSLVRVLPDPQDNNASDGIDLYVAGLRKIYIGYDNGSVWETLSPQPELLNGQLIMDMEINKDGDIIIGTFDIWGTGKGNAYILDNGEEEWTEILTASDPAIDTLDKRVKISTPTEDNEVFALKEIAGVRMSLHASYDGGHTWSLVNESIVYAAPKMEIEYSENTEKIYVAGKWGMEVLSKTNGNTVHNFRHDIFTFHDDLRDINFATFSNGIEKVYAANDGGITETIFNNNDPSSSYAVNKNGSYLPCNNSIGLAVANSSGKEWFMGAVHQGVFSFSGEALLNNSRGDGEDGVYHPLNSNIYYRKDWGWIRDNEDKLIHGSGWFIGAPLEMFPQNPDVLYFGLSNGLLGIYDGKTGEKTLSSVESTNIGETMVSVGAIALSKDLDIYVSDNEKQDSNDPSIFMVSTNNGDTWYDKSFSPVWNNGSNVGNLSQVIGWTKINGIVCNPDNNDELWIAIGGIKQDEYLRVLHSTDGGDNWDNYSEGLTEFPCIDFLYHYPTETLFLGTDVGVFYRQPFNDQNSEWACFSDGLPVGAITELDVNECTNELFVSIQSRSVFATPIPFAVVNSAEEVLLSGAIIDAPGTIWNNSKTFDGDVYITPGADLTINKACYFSEGNKIVVLPGGQLIVNATLQPRTCVNTWQGIQVAGNSNLGQHPDNQGLVYLNSDASIYNAVSGVATYQHNAQGHVIADSYGGIIKANGATFTNCRVACEIVGYTVPLGTSNWQTDISNCNFLFSGAYYELFEPYAETPRFIEIINNKVLKFENNTFESTKPILDNWTQYPIGILKYNSQVIVSNNDFIGLSYGIYSRDYYPGSFVDKISGNTFKQNIYSIYENGVMGSQIYDNEFKYFDFNNMEFSNQDNYIGVYKDACTNYLLEENDFKGKFNVIDKPIIGLIVNNGGPNNQSIYKNYFEGNDYAILAQGSNRNTDGSSGLSFKCNQMILELNDISVSAQEGTINKGIAAAQGSPAGGATMAAGNRFNATNYYQTHFWNLSDPIATYHHHNMEEQSDGTRDIIIPGHVDPSLDMTNGLMIMQNNESQWNLGNSCPSNLTGGIGGKLAKLASNAMVIDETESLLTQLVDAGDTEEMANDVETADNSEAYQLRNELLNSSPYLSNEVLENAANKEDVLTNPLIRDVLVANPQAAKNVEVLDLVENRMNPMPQYMKDQILNGQTTIGSKEVLEAERQHSKTNYNIALSMLVAEYSNELGDNYDPDALIELLSDAKNKEARYQLASVYLEENNGQAMNTALNSIANDFDLSAEESTELSDMSTYFNLLKLMKEEGRTAAELNDSEIDELQALYENAENKAAVYARNLLLFGGHIDYEAPVIYPDMMDKSSLIRNVNSSDPKPEDLVYIDVYPNPAKDYIIFEYDIAVEYQNARLLIFDGAKGQILTHEVLLETQNSLTIGLEKFGAGSYLASIEVDGKVLKSIKFTLTK